MSAKPKKEKVIQEMAKIRTKIEALEARWQELNTIRKELDCQQILRLLEMEHMEYDQVEQAMTHWKNQGSETLPEQENPTYENQ